MIQKINMVNFGMGIYLPKNVLTNAELEKRNITLPSGRLLKASQILEKIGVERRHIARDTETAADLGYEAALPALHDNNQVDLIIASSSHPTPFHIAGEIAKRLKFANAECLDIHAACSGSALMFSYLLENKKRLSGKNVLLIAADKFSNTIVDLTRTDSMMLDSSLGQTIFGDGAAAIRFEYERDIAVHFALDKPLPDPGGKTDLILMAMGTNNFVPPCIVKPVAASPLHKDFPQGYFTQYGPKVFEIVQNAVPDTIREAVEKSGIKAKDIKLVVLHPGSKRVVEAIQSKLAPDFLTYSNYADGNMSSASLLYSFIKAIQEKRIERGDKVVLCGFGAGSPHLYSSTVVIELL